MCLTFDLGTPTLEGVLSFSSAGLSRRAEWWGPVPLTVPVDLPLEILQEAASRPAAVLASSRRASALCHEGLGVLVCE